MQTLPIPTHHKTREWYSQVSQPSVIHALPLPSPVRLNPDQDIQTLHPPLLLPQQPLDPLITLSFAPTRLSQANPPLDSLHRRAHPSLDRRIHCLRQHASAFRHSPIQRQLRTIRQRRIEPRCVKVEERDDEDEEEEAAVHARSV